MNLHRAPRRERADQPPVPRRRTACPTSPPRGCASLRQAVPTTTTAHPRSAAVPDHPPHATRPASRSRRRTGCPHRDCPRHRQAARRARGAHRSNPDPLTSPHGRRTSDVRRHLAGHRNGLVRPAPWDDLDHPHAGRPTHALRTSPADRPRRANPRPGGSTLRAVIGTRRDRPRRPKRRRSATGVARGHRSRHHFDRQQRHRHLDPTGRRRYRHDAGHPAHPNHRRGHHRYRQTHFRVAPVANRRASTWTSRTRSRPDLRLRPPQVPTPNRRAPNGKHHPTLDRSLQHRRHTHGAHPRYHALDRRPRLAVRRNAPLIRPANPRTGHLPSRRRNRPSVRTLRHVPAHPMNRGDGRRGSAHHGHPHVPDRSRYGRRCSSGPTSTISTGHHPIPFHSRPDRPRDRSPRRPTRARH